jgi:hypothetical protein
VTLRRIMGGAADTQSAYINRRSSEYERRRLARFRGLGRVER